MVFSKTLWYGICGSLLALVACGSKSLQPANPAAETTNRQPVMTTEKPSGKGIISPASQVGQPERIPPGNCRLVGKIVSVLTDLEPDKKAPCGQVPCRAVVKIRQILGYGAAFGQPLAKGQEIKVYFQFTLSPTNRYFPELTTPLPGLKTGSIFQADVKRAGEGASGQVAWFQVYRYTLLK